MVFIMLTSPKWFNKLESDPTLPEFREKSPRHFTRNKLTMIVKCYEILSEILNLGPALSLLSSVLENIVSGNEHSYLKG